MKSILRPLRWLYSLDRSYFLALCAFVAALAASIYLAVAPTYVSTSASGVETSHTLIEVNGAWIVVVLIVPLLIMLGPLVVLSQQTEPVRRNHKVNSVVTTLVLLAFVALSIWSIGLLYVPALILSTASSVSLFFGRDRRRPGAVAAKQDRQRPKPPQSGGGDNQPRMSGKKARRGRAKR